MKKIGAIFFAAWAALACRSGETPLPQADATERVPPQSPKSKVQHYVDVFVGTSATGHTTPAATVPFGLVQAGPDTGNESWHYCSGYRYEDRRIYGFSQTHLSGTGCMSLGDVRLLPFASETVPDALAFEKADESAGPGWYAVKLDGGVGVEIAAAPHGAIYRFRYAKNAPKRLLVDAQWGVTYPGGLMKHVSSSTVKPDGLAGVSGTYHSHVWSPRAVSFKLVFGKTARRVAELPRAKGQKSPRYVFDFDLAEGEDLCVKIALSATSVEKAAANLAAEIPAWDFAAAKAAAAAAWEEIFARAECIGDEAAKKNWYTSLYHLFFQPNNLGDAGDAPFYSTFSTWDTFRAAHPLYTLLAPDKVPDFVSSLLEQGRRTGHLPIWALWGHDNQCMIGTHSIPVLADACLKGFPGDWDRAYAQIVDTLRRPHKGRAKENWDLLDKYGYYPFDVIRGESVSRTFECAYDDWCAAQMAAKMGHADDAAFFLKRSANWKNVFDPAIGFARGKDSKGVWRTPFNPYALGHGEDSANDFTEGNAFQYSWHVMQDPEGLMAAMGGRTAFLAKLDGLFSAPSEGKGQGKVLDVTGLIGQYVHGNEPSHHVIYFYTLAGRPDKAAERVRDVFDRFYLPKPDGLCGNDDCGQMSAWYLFSAMGFYPFNPCGGEYVLGAPQVEGARVDVGGGRRLVMRAVNFSRANKYVKRATWNGKPVADGKLRHADLAQGGELVFEMAAAPFDDAQAREDWLAETARKTVAAAARRMDDGRVVYNPDAGGTYRATWLRDYCYMLEADAVPHENVAAASRLFLDAVSTNGWGVDCVKYDGTRIYQPGYGTMGRLAVADGAPFTVAAAYLAWKNTGDAAWLAAPTLAILDRALRAAPVCPGSPLAFISPDEKWERAAYGFTDSVRKKGHVLFESLLLCEARRRYAEMLRAAGRPAEAAREEETARAIAKAVNETFWDDALGLYRAATVACREGDVWGSAFAVWLGVAEDRRADAVAATFARNFDALTQNGQVRHTLPGVYWESACRRDHYQNGGCWGTPAGWFAWTLERHAPALADRLYRELQADFAAHGVCEWSLDGKRACNAGYPASVCLPLAAWRRIRAQRESR